MKKLEKTRIDWLKDSVGNNYLAIHIFYYQIEEYIRTFVELMDSREEADRYMLNQKTRDSYKYHITVFSLDEVDKLTNQFGKDKAITIFEHIKDFDVNDIIVKGIGKAEKNGNKTYFIVSESNSINNLRKIYGFEEKDLHITIGFDRKDVFGVRKNEVIKSPSPFFKLFRSNWYTKPNLSFFRSIGNFPNINTIEPILVKELREDRITIWTDNKSIEISTTESKGEHKFWCMAIYRDIVRPVEPITQTDILKFIKEYER